MSTTGLQCVICGADGDLELHHVAGHANVAAATVPVCRSRHDAYHELLRDAGVQLARGSGDDPARCLWAVACGFSAVIAESAKACGGDPALVDAIERFLIDCARLLTLLAPPESAIGPDPIANDRRRARRTRAGHTRQRRGRECASRPAATPGEIDARGAAFIRGFLPAIAATARELLGPHTRSAEFVRTVERIAVGAESIARVSSQMDISPRRGEVESMLRRERELVGGLPAQLLDIERTGVVDEAALAALQRFADTGRRHLRFATALIEARDDDAIFAAIDDLLDDEVSA